MIVAARLAGAWAAWSIGDYRAAATDFIWVEVSLLSTPEEVREAQAGRSLCRLALGYAPLKSVVRPANRRGVEVLADGLGFLHCGDPTAALVAFGQAFPPDGAAPLPRGPSPALLAAFVDLCRAIAVEREGLPESGPKWTGPALEALLEAGAEGVAEAALARRLRARIGQLVPPPEQAPRCFAEVLATVEEALAAYRAAREPEGVAFKAAGERLYKALRPAVAEGQPWSLDLLHVAVEAAWTVVQWEEDTGVHRPAS